MELDVKNTSNMELWNTSKCKENADLINSFENHFYPIEFFTKIEDVTHWLKSEMFFCNTIVEKKKILSTLSFLITDKISYINILEGKIFEKELIPYNFSDKPSLYLESFIISKSKHSYILVRSILKEIKEFTLSKNIIINQSFSIAATKDGESFLEKNHFNKSGRYCRIYSIYTLENNWENSIYRFLF